jgi:hypothetical protein
MKWNLKFPWALQPLSLKVPLPYATKLHLCNLIHFSVVGQWFALFSFPPQA